MRDKTLGDSFYKAAVFREKIVNGAERREESESKTIGTEQIHDNTLLPKVAQANYQTDGWIGKA